MKVYTVLESIVYLRWKDERADTSYRHSVHGVLCDHESHCQYSYLLSLTADEDKETVRSIALRSVFIAFVIVAIFAIAGKVIFDLFGITLYALRITGES